MNNKNIQVIPKNVNVENTKGRSHVGVILRDVPPDIKLGNLKNHVIIRIKHKKSDKKQLPPDQYKLSESILAKSTYLIAVRIKKKGKFYVEAKWK